MAENRYCDIEAFLDTIPQYAGESGVVRAGALLEELGHPEKTLKIIHVAGSNGKGSVCAYLNRILIQHGFRTGLFTSPHLVDVRERIRIDNEMVSKSDFVQAFDRVHSAAKRLQKKNITLAYFDWLFGMALLLFVQKQADFVILETGLGGRLDATNAVQNPVLSVITTISLEHTAVLGDTISQIAKEKAGILKQGVSAVYSAKEPEVIHVMEQTAENAGVPVLEGVTPADYQITKNTGKRIDFSLHNGYYKNDCFSLATGAVYQAENCSLALTGAALLQKAGILQLDEGKVRQAVFETCWEGRMEEIEPDIYIDGAHNPEGIEAFIRSARSICGKRPAVLLFSVVKDKNFEQMIGMLAASGVFTHYIIVQMQTKRHLAGESIEELFAKYTSAPLTEFDESFDGYLYGKKLQEEIPDSVLFCTGSLYLAGEIKQKLQNGR